MEKAIGMKPIISSTQRVMGICLLLFTTNAYSQDFKLAGLHYANYPKSEINNGSGGEKTSFNEFGFFVNVPKTFKNDSTILINGLGYASVNATMYNFSGLPSNEEDKKLQTFYYQVSLLHKWNDKWSFVASLKPTIASDFEQSLSIDDFVLQASVLVSKKMNDKMKLGVGVLNSTRWGSPLVLPALSFHYKHKKHQLNALLPVNLKYTYSFLPKNNLILGMKYARNGADFNVYSSTTANVNKINYSRANIGFLATYKPRKFMRFELHTGISTGRTYNLIDDNLNVTDFSSKAEPFVTIGFSIVLPQKD